MLALFLASSVSAFTDPNYTVEIRCTTDSPNAVKGLVVNYEIGHGKVKEVMTLPSQKSPLVDNWQRPLFSKYAVHNDASRNSKISIYKAAGGLEYYAISHVYNPFIVNKYKCKKVNEFFGKKKNRSSNL